MDLGAPDVITGPRQAVLGSGGREFVALSAVSASLNSSLDLDEMLRQTLRALTAVVPCPAAAIRLYDEWRRALVPAAVQGWLPDERPLRAIGIDEADAIAAAVRSGRSDFVPDVQGVPGLRPLRNPASPRALLIVPLSHDEQSLGCITLARPVGERFTDAEREIAVAVARQTAVAIQNARLYAQAERRRREEAALNAIAQDLAASLDRETVFQRIVDHARSLLGGYFARIVLFDPASGLLRSNAVSGEKTRLWPDGDLRPGEGVVGHVWETGQPLAIEDYLADPRFKHLPVLDHRVQQAGSIAILGVPIALGAEQLGVLLVGDHAGRRFTEDDEALLARLAAQAALAVRNTRLYAEARQRASRLEFLNEIGRELSAELDLDRFLTVAWRQLARVVGVESCWLALWDEATGELDYCLYVNDGLRLPDAERRAQPGRGLARALLEERATIRVPDYVAECHRRGLTPSGPAIDRPGNAWLGVPLLTGGRVVGAMAVWRWTGPFSSEDTATLETLAGQVAAALENARLYDQARQRAAELAELNEVARVTSSSLALPEIFRALYEAVRRVLPTDVFLVTLEQAPGDFRHVLAIDDGQEYQLHGRPPKHPALLTALAQCQPVLDNDLPESPPPEYRFGSPKRSRSLLAAPLVIGDRCLGLLSAQSYRVGAYHAGDAALLGAIARQVASAIDNTRLFAETQALYRGSVESLAAAVDARDAYTHRHSCNVAFYGCKIARELGLPRGEGEDIELAALLHDIGKIGIADAILSKPGKLSTSEMALMVAHVTRGATILSANQALAPLVPLVKHHHEWHNGAGYPDGLAGDDIPLGAAIIAVADAFDTMTNDRAYRRARGLAAARRELAAMAGRQFNPRVVDAFLRALRCDELSGAPYVTSLRKSQAAESRESTPMSGAAGCDKEPAGQIKPWQSKELAVLHYLAREVGALTNLHRFLNGAVRVLERELGYRDCALLLLDEETGDLVVESASDFDTSLPGYRLPRGRGIAGWVVEHRQTENVPDVRADPRSVIRHPSKRSVLTVPLLSGEQCLGVIAIGSDREAAFSADDELTLETVAKQLANAIAVARLHEREKRAAITDGLTGAFNHRYFYQRLEQELARAERNGRSLVVAIMDVNDLKALNDTQGHVAGDVALRVFSAVLRAAMRRSDIIARYGGDEFAVILPDTTPERARGLLKRLQARLRATHATEAGATIGPFSAAIGLAAFPEDGTRATALVAAADGRMYEHKRAIRRAARADEPALSPPPR